MPSSMTPHASQVEAVAAAIGLSKAERKWLPEFDETPRQWYPIGCSRRTRDSLIRTGLVQEHRPRSGFGMVKWSLTSLGRQVRAHLEQAHAGE